MCTYVHVSICAYRENDVEGQKKAVARERRVLCSSVLLLAAGVSRMSWFQPSGLTPLAWGPSGSHSLPPVSGCPGPRLSVRSTERHQLAVMLLPETLQMEFLGRTAGMCVGASVMHGFGFVNMSLLNLGWATGLGALRSIFWQLLNILMVLKPCLYLI